MTKLKLVETFENEIKVVNKYEIGHYLVRHSVYVDGRKVLSIHLKEDAPRFAPDLWTEDTSYYDDTKFVFEIQTSSYGALNMEEFDKFMKELETAKKIIEVLNKHFNK